MSLRAAEESPLTKFQYPCLCGDEKSWSEGVITKDKFHVQHGSTYPGDAYDKKGITPERCWALILWLNKFGTEEKECRGYEAAFTRADGTSVRKLFPAGRTSLLFRQIVEDCRAEISESAHNEMNESELLKLEYSCAGEKKHGEITKESFQLQQTRNYAPTIERNGATPESVWELVKWLYKYSSEVKDDPPPATAYVVTFYFPKEKTIKKALLAEHILSKLLGDCGD